jgi:hypothetical protein
VVVTSILRPLRLLSGVDIDIASYGFEEVYSRELIVGLCPIERGGALTHKHFQMMVKGNSLAYMC